MEFNLFKTIRKKSEVQKQVDTYFRLMNAYTPVFTTFEGGVYEMALTRRAIDCFATHCSKLLPEVTGANNNTFQRFLQTRPNPNMNTQQYLYQLATKYRADNTVFILPIYDESYSRPVAFYPVRRANVEYLVYQNGDYFKFNFVNGSYTLPKDEIGILNRFTYASDFYGAKNDVLRPTLDLINATNEGIIEGLKNSASVRFIAKLSSVLKPDDIAKERKRLVEDNLSAQNNGGAFLVDAKYDDVKQISSEPYTVNAAQMREIEESVYTFFGVNKNILQSKFTPDEWAAYYESEIEPFAIQAGLVHTNMKFTDRELGFGNEILFTSNRLQYESTQVKLNVGTSLFDRGVMTQNQVCDIFQLPHVEGGDRYFIRKEYQDTSIPTGTEGNNEQQSAE